MSITTPVGTLSFPSLFQPTAFNGSDPKFTTMLIFDEGEDISALESAIEQALIKKFGSVPASWNSPIKDGNTKKDKDGNVRAEFANRKFITVKCKASEQPAVYDSAVQLVIDPREVYGGAKARVSVNPFGYEMGGKGVSLYLKGVQLTGEGEPFGVATSAADDFTKAPF
jgi:hypothetical protein